MNQGQWIKLGTAMVFVAAASACNTTSSSISTKLRRQLAQIPYPNQAPHGDLDIIVGQDNGEIIVTNRTASTYDQVYLWLDQQYVGLLEHIPIGIASRMPLAAFINEYGESYPIGGFLTPDKTRSFVLAELFTTQRAVRADSIEIRDYSPIRFRLLVRQHQDTDL